MSFVIAVSKSTGQKQEIPAKWLDHPVLGKDFELAPSQLPLGTPDESWTVKQLTQYAADHAIDLAGATRKDDVLAAIHTSTDESPATGEEE